jgi:hypothetical protein
VARFDKYDPISGGFRAPLAADWAGPVGEPVGVGLDTDGRVVPGSGNTGVVGVVVVDGQLSPAGTRTANRFAGDIMDVMTDGEIVDVDGLAAGTVYFAAGADGAVSATGPAAGVNASRVGHTVEAQRLVVRAAQVQG